MSRKVPLDGLADAISDIMAKYSDSAYGATEKAVEYATKKGTQQIKANSAIFGGTGKYKGGWRYKIDKTGVTTTGTIYNAATPGLPHLLEHGHAKVVGGRRYPDPVPGREHIAPVQQQLDEILPKRIKIELDEGRIPGV